MKVWNYVVVMIGMVVILYIAGVDTGNEELINIIGLGLGDAGIEQVNVNTSTIMDAVFASWGILGGLLALGVGIVASFAGVRSRLENLILLPLITGTLAGFVQAFKGVMTTMIDTGQQWAIAIIVIMFIPFSIGFIIALAEFFRGTD